ncbi:TniQ family protein [Ideonella sp.]|uniref:TniQ family protein n=1 Tax=Ideonella sp. TaxID=1929293 RepID=UPI0035B41A07
MTVELEGPRGASTVGQTATAPSQASPTFVRCRELQPGESLASLVQWHCTQNVVPRLSTLFSLLSKCGGEAVRTLHDLAQSPTSLCALERVTRQPAGALAHLRRKTLRAAVEDGYEARVVEGAYEWPQFTRARKLQAVCPQCLREHGYGFANWDFVQAPVCLRHGVRLLDHCDHCSVPIEMDRLAMLRCARCSRALGQAVSKPVDETVLAAARLVQASRVQAFGTADDNFPVEPHDISGLLRLLLLGEASRPVDFGLKGDLEDVSIDQRVAALRLLGQTLAGTRIDSTRLRELSRRRWVFEALLPEAERSRLLREACATAVLPADVTAMLCGDRERAPLPTAVEHFKPWQPPRIFKLQDLANRLGLSREDLRLLMAEEGISEVKPSHYGFDMDDVLRLERALAEMLPLNQVDDLLGWPGLATELMSMRLVVGLTLGSGEQLVHPRSVTSLFERAQQTATVTTGRKAMVTLAAAARATGLDARQVAWALWRILSGSVPNGGWQEPYRLTSLLVIPEQLQAHVIAQSHGTEAFTLAGAESPSAGLAARHCQSSEADDD